VGRDSSSQEAQTVRPTLHPATSGDIAPTVRPRPASGVDAATSLAVCETVSTTRVTGPGALAVLKVVNYRRFAAGQSLSLIGSWTHTIAEGLLVWQVTHSSIVLGLVAAIRYMPVLIGTPYAGLIVDRHDRRHMLMLTSTVLGVTSL